MIPAKGSLLMISRRYWYLGTAFATAALSVLFNPASVMAIALCSLGLTLLACNWCVKGGIQGGIVLLSLIFMCLIVPQVETNTALFTSPIDRLKSDLRLT